MKTKSSPTGNTEQFNDATIAEYSDGSWRYTGDNGKTKGSLARKPAWLTSFNKETSLAASEVKKSIKQEDAAIGVMRAAESISPRKIRTSHEGMQFIYEKQAELAMAPDAPGSTAAAKFVEQAHYGGTAHENPRVLIHVDNATLIAGQQTERMIEEFGDTDIVEGEFAEN